VVPDYMWRNSKAYRIISDQLGSVGLVVDTTTTPATVIQQFDYDEFGNVLSSSFDSSCSATCPCFPFQPFGFAGGLQDRDTGLVRFGARDYQPFTGRWVSKDPIRFAGGSTNLFVYASDDPVNRVDINGLVGVYMQVGVYFGAGPLVGVGFEGNVGVFIDFSQPLGWNTVTPYWEVGGGLDGVTLLSFGAGPTVGLALDSAAFWGTGSEVGFNSSAGGPDVTLTSDGRFNGFGFGWGPAFGADVHALTSSTQPVSVHSIVAGVAACF
jgi:RHS repeat-associated protein